MQPNVKLQHIISLHLDILEKLSLLPLTMLTAVFQIYDFLHSRGLLVQDNRRDQPNVDNQRLHVRENQYE